MKNREITAVKMSMAGGEIVELKLGDIIELSGYTGESGGYDVDDKRAAKAEKLRTIADIDVSGTKMEHPRIKVVVRNFKDELLGEFHVLSIAMAAGSTRDAKKMVEFEE